LCFVISHLIPCDFLSSRAFPNSIFWEALDWELWDKILISLVGAQGQQHQRYINDLRLRWDSDPSGTEKTQKLSHRFGRILMTASDRVAGRR
jgi:hypothetical protein